MELAVQGKGIPIGSTGMSGALFLHIQIRYPPAFSAMELNDLRAKLESREVIKEDGEWEETELFLRFKAMRRLQMIGESTGLAWSEADFLYSAASSPRFQCVPWFWFWFWFVFSNTQLEAIGFFAKMRAESRRDAVF